MSVPDRAEWRKVAERWPDQPWSSESVLALLDENDALRARIQAVREMHRSIGLTAHTGPRIKPGGEPIPDDTQVCDYCTDPDALGWCEYPCPTIEALNGDA